MAQPATTHTRFLELYQPCHDRLGRFVATQVWDKEEARDVVSETLLTAMENFSKLRSADAFLHFLFGIAIRLIRKRQRRGWRQLLFGDNGWEALHEKQLTESTDDEADLQRLLKVLGEKSREAIVLFEISGFTIKEICEIQDCSESAVKSRLARARKTLEKAVASEKKTLVLKTI